MLGRMSHLTRKALPVVLLALVGLSVSVTIEVVHRRLATDVAYASFCNVNERVNCDVVLSSRYASFLGVPLSRWAILFYTGIAAGGVASTLARRAAPRQRIAGALVLATLWGLLFSAYLGTIAVVVLRTICVMCLALYVTNIALCVAVWNLRGTLRMAGHRQVAEEQARFGRWVFWGGVAATAVLVGVTLWEVIKPGLEVSDPRVIERERPDFYRWYTSRPVVAVPSGGRNARGRADAPVTIIEFSDFECAHCAAFDATLETVLRRLGDSVRVVFRHFPLDADCNARVPGRFHPQACLAAVAAECAGEQGRFWAYHRLLFANQRHLSERFLLDSAAQLGLDRQRFATCLTGEAARARVRQDAQAGTELGIDSTPTLFINGRKIQGALDPQRLADAIVLARSGR
jgi:protein-disulfide isomerase/uncharacterized membrane protein